MTSPTVLFCTLLAVLWARDSVGSRLELPRILLPIFNSITVNFTMEVHGHGCFVWSCSRPDLLFLIPDGVVDRARDCSNKVRIQVITRDHTRATAVLLAKDVHSEQVFRADITLDAIKTLSIETTVRELYLEEAPVMFEVQAHDEQGNRFTTLEGVEFYWTLHNGPKDASPVLNFITFRESPYEIPSAVSQFDAEGRRGHLVLIEGIKTGTSKVSVQLPYPEYKRVPKIEVNLSVIENLILSPIDAVILPGDVIGYKLTQFRQGHSIEVEFLSSDRYSLHCNDTSVASVSNNVVRGLKLGVVLITLIDENSPVSSESAKPSAHLTVAEPFYLTMSMSPYNSWVLMEGQRGNFTVELYDSENHKIHLGPKSRIDISFSKDSFRVLKTLKNGAHVQGVANVASVSHVKATLVPPAPNEMSKVISVNSMLHVYPKLSISPTRSFVPWQENLFPRYQIQHKASGGDGTYEWKSTNAAVAEVVQNGIATITGPGESKIRVCPKWDTECYNKAEASIFSVVPSYMEILNHVNEAEIGTPIFLNIVLYGRVFSGGNVIKVKLSDCQSLEFNVTVDPGFLFNRTMKTDPVGDACGVVAVVGTKSAFSKVAVSYHTGASVLEAFTAVSSYKRLSPKYPKPEVDVVLAVGSSRIIVFQDGPPPVRNIQSEISLDPTIASYSTVLPTYAYRVTCRKLGSTTFNLTLKSSPVISTCLGVEDSSSVRIICAYPEQILIETEKKRDCPRSIDRTIVNRGSTLELNVVIKDNYGRIFDNATSLKFDWSIDHEETASFDSPDLVSLKERKVDSHLVLPDHHYKILHLKNKIGDITIHCKIIGYRTSLLEELGISVGWVGPEHVDTTHVVVVVDDPVIEPENVSIINHRLNTAVLSISKGSGHFGLEMSPESLATVDYISPTIRLTPKGEGIGTLTVTDACIFASSLVVPVQIFKLGKLHVELRNRIKIKDTVTAHVRLQDGQGRHISFPTIEEDELELSVAFGNPSILSVETLETVSDGSRVSIKYKFIGETLGETSVVFKCLGMTSEAITVQVFQPVRIEPRSLTITVGAEIQVAVIGGPQPDPGIQFTVSDGFFISVSPKGIVKGRHNGRTTLTAESMGSSGELYSKDSIEVIVIPLTGVRIAAPISRLGVGNVMPLCVTGVPSTLSPFVLGSISPSLIFKWSASLPSVAHIQDPLESTNVEVRNEEKLCVRLVGLKPGQTQISVIVSGRAPEKSFVFNNTIDIEVVELFGWRSPLPKEAEVLVSPGSSFHADTNAEEGSYVKYSIFGFDSCGGSFPKSGLEVTDSGFVTVGSRLGSYFLQAEHSDQFQTIRSISLRIHVSDVQYILVNVLNVLPVKERTQSLPQGLILMLNVTYHDLYGSVFHAALSQIHVKANIFDKVHLSKKSNDEISVSLERTGFVTLRIFDVTTNMEDFLKIPVENHIHPQKTQLTEGEIVCFNVDSSAAEEGTWSSDNAVVHIDQTGTAFANKVGTSVIRFTVDKPNSKISSTLTIEVLPVQTVQLGTPKGLILTNSGPGAKYSVPVQLLNDKQKKDSPFLSKSCRKKPQLRANFPFKCEIRFNNVRQTTPIEKLFTIQPAFDPTLGTYVCEIMAVEEPSQNTSVIQSDVTVRVVLPMQPALADSIVLTFLPGVYVSPSRIHFSPDKTVETVNILGAPVVLQQISVHSNGNKFLVSSLKIYGNGCSFSVNLDSTNMVFGERFTLGSITINSPLTNQTIVVPIALVNRAAAVANLPEAWEWNTNSFLAYVIYNVVSTPAFMALLFTTTLVLICKKYLFSDQLPRRSAFEAAQTPPRLAQLLDESLQRPGSIPIARRRYRQSPYE